MSHSHNEHRKALERELHNASVTHSIERTDGGHMRIVFEVNGKSQMITTSWTPSDHRTTLNARARIRKILRDHHHPLDQPPPSKLQQALAVPAPTEPYGERIRQLESDVGVLLDMLATLAEKAGINLEPPTPEPPAPVVVQAEVKRRSPRSKVHTLLLSMEYQWLSITEIARREKPRTYAAVSVALNNLKRQGLVENGARGMWRKIPEHVRHANGNGRANGALHAASH